MTDFAGLISTLGKHEVEYIIIGGAAAIAHGSARFTQDLDVLYRRAAANLDRIIEALSAYRPYLRGAPPGLPFVWDRDTLQRGLNFTLITSLGDIDLMGEIPGGGTWEDLYPKAIEVELFGQVCMCLSLQQLIRAKTAAGRPKDLEAIAELEAIQEELPGA